MAVVANMDTGATRSIGRTKPISAEHSSLFNVGAREAFGDQFYHLYMSRLELFKPILMDTMLRREGVSIVPTLLEINNYSGKLAIFGTVYKEMSKKPAALDEFLVNAKPKPKITASQGCFVSDDDEVVLEDASSRLLIKMEDGSTLKKIYTGTAVALIGHNDAAKSFNATEVIFAGFAPQTQIPKQMGNAGGAPRWVALMSGINFGQQGDNNLAIQMMTDWIEGYLGSDRDAEEGAKVVRVIIAGNTFAPNEADCMDEIELALRNRRARSLDDDKANSELKKLDSWLASLCSSVDVDVMPGATDPSNFYLPQRAFHRCLLPKCAQISTYHPVSNPYSATIDGFQFLGVSGQNIRDQRMYGHTATIPLMEQHLLSRNICPTAPDSLGCFPFMKNDPFVLHHTPHVYFVGCQEEFAVSTTKDPEVRLVSVPSFCETQEIVLLNLATTQLECRKLSFRA